jgi:hypothetical protein
VITLITHENYRIGDLVQASDSFIAGPWRGVNKLGPGIVIGYNKRGSERYEIYWDPFLKHKIATAGVNYNIFHSDNLKKLWSIGDNIGHSKNKQTL